MFLLFTIQNKKYYLLNLKSDLTVLDNTLTCSDLFLISQYKIIDSVKTKINTNTNDIYIVIQPKHYLVLTVIFEWLQQNHKTHAVLNHYNIELFAFFVQKINDSTINIHNDIILIEKLYLQYLNEFIINKLIKSFDI